MKLTDKHLLLLILLLGGALRIWHLPIAPSGLNLDEASIGYNAYAIGSEGIDEQGSHFPLLFKAFGEYKNPVFIYSLVPFVKLFGLSVGVIRFVAALYGIGTILLLFLIGSRLFSKKAGLLASFFLAISPWHLLFSRMSLEVITLPFFFLLGFYFLLGKTKKDYVLSGVFFGISLYTYAAAKLFVPLFFFCYILIHKKEMLTNTFIRMHWKSALILLLIALPIYYLSFFGHGNERFMQVSAISADHPGTTITSNYLSYYSPRFLFFQGDSNVRNSVPGYGQFLPVMAVLFLLGIYWMANTLGDKRTQLLLCWLLLYPLPAALTSGPMPNALRGLTHVGVFSLIMAQGTISFFTAEKIRASRPLMVILGILVIAIVWQAALFGQDYFQDYPSQVAHKQQYGLTDAIMYAESIQTNQTIFISNEIKQAYIYVLFERKTPASHYLADGLKGIAFCDIENCSTTNAIYIVIPTEIAQYQPEHVIYNPAGIPA